MHEYFLSYCLIFLKITFSNSRACHKMDQSDHDTIMRSVIDLNNRLDLNQRFLSLLQNEYRVFSKQMVEDIMVTVYSFI